MDGDEPVKPPKIPTKDLNRAFTAPMQPSKPFIQPSPSPAAREAYKAHTEQRATKPHSSLLADVKRTWFRRGRRITSRGRTPDTCPRFDGRHPRARQGYCVPA